MLTRKAVVFLIFFTSHGLLTVNASFSFFDVNASSHGDNINYRINNMNFNNADNNYEADLPAKSTGIREGGDESSYYDTTSMYDRGIARLSQSSIESNMLFDQFFSPNANYSRYVLPRQKIAGKAVTVKLLLTLIQLGDVDERNQIMSTMIWVNHEWQDVSLSWDPSNYGGLTMLHIPSELVWIPDTVLYNNADGDYQLSTRAKVTVHYSGTIRWEPPAIYRSFCLIDVTYFPFDDQACDLKLGPWTFDVHVVNYVHLRAPDVDFLIDAIDKSRYFESVEWEIIAVPGKRNEVYYTGLTEGYVDITYTLLLRRKALFYTVNLIAPCLAISLLTIFVFYLPSESGEKVTLSISILLSLTFFIILLADLVPPTSLIVPLIGKYLLFTMTLVTLSIMSTVVVLAVFRNPMNTLQPLPEWVRYTFLRMLPRLLLMKLRKVERSAELIRLESTYHAEDCRQEATTSDEYGDEFQDYQYTCQERYQKIRPPNFSDRIISSESGFFAMKRASYNANNPYQKPSHKRGQQRRVPSFFAAGNDIFNNNLGDDQYDMGSMSSAASITSSVTYNRTNPYYSNNNDDEQQGDENSKFVYVKRQFIKSTLDDVASIVEYCRQEEKEELLQKEWETVARVLDRLFLVLYSCSCIFGILTILLSAPSLWGVEHKAFAEFRKLAADYPYNLNQSAQLMTGASQSAILIKV